MLTRSSQISLPGEDETVIQLGIESRVGEVGLMQVTPFWACPLFLTPVNQEKQSFPGCF